MYNKQKNAAGKAYYGGKAIAAVSDKLSSVFGNSNEITNNPSNQNDATTNTEANKDKEVKKNEK